MLITPANCNISPQIIYKSIITIWYKIVKNLLIKNKKKA